MNPIRNIIGEELASKVAPVMQINEEGEMRHVWGYSGIEDAWILIGQHYE
jgi:hypothetical protein